MNRTFKFLSSYFIITLGLFLNALGWTAFLIPSHITGGGLNGVCTIIFFSTGIPVGLSFLALNALLLLFSMKILGASFGIKTIYAIFMLSAILGVLQGLIKSPFVKDPFMATIIGGILSGSGIGLVFTQGGSTGGTDILAMMVTKYKNISPAKVILVIDLFIIASSYLIFHSVEKLVYGYFMMAVNAYAIDLVIEGAKQSVQIFIISDKSQEIAYKIGEITGRGVTILNGKGWYSYQDKEVIMFVTSKWDSNQILKAVKEIDEDSFISVASVMGVYGKKYEKIKPF